MQRPPGSRIATAIALVVFATYLSGCALLLAGAAAGGAAGAAVSARDSEKEQHSPMTYMATVLVNAVYVPAKVVFAGAGALASGFTYVATFGDSNATNRVWDAALQGNYVVTPRMVEGKEAVQFVGS